MIVFFFFSSRRRHTRFKCDWSSDVCSSDLVEKFRTWSDCHGDVEKSFTRDQILTNVMIYWVTQKINSSTRLYYEARHHPWRLKPGTRIEAPTAVALFPGALVRPPRHWAELVYNVRRWTRV